MGLTVFGVILITKHVIDSVLERKRRRQFQKRVLDAAAKRAELEREGSKGARESVSDSTRKEDAVPDLCVICLEQEYNAVFVPCPLCRRRIDQVVKTNRH